MGMFSFIKEAGEKLFGHKEVEKAAEAAASDPAAQATLDELNTTAAHAIRDYIETQNLGVSGLYVSFDGASGKVTVQGEAPTQEASEKVTLCCGNVGGVREVENLMSVADARRRGTLPRRRARRHAFGHCQDLLWQRQQIPGNF